MRWNLCFEILEKQKCAGICDLNPIQIPGIFRKPLFCENLDHENCDGIYALNCEVLKCSEFERLHVI